MEELKANYRLAQLAFERYKSETLVNIKNEIDGMKERLIEVESQLQEIEKRIALNMVRAPISGTIQVLQEFNVGDYMPAGIEVLRIIPEDSEKYKVEIMVQNRDISQLKIGQKIKYRFLALPYKEYGTLDGKITKISEDAVLSQGEPNMAYKVEGSINSTRLYDKNGKPTEIRAGMLCEARVVVRQKKIIYFVLEKLDFLS
jgi:HlyD family secretion protein